MKGQKWIALWGLSSRKDFSYEIYWIAKTLGIDKRRVCIDNAHPTGEDVIFIDDVYNGYLDSRFYDFVEYGLDEFGDFREWVEMWREKDEKN